MIHLHKLSRKYLDFEFSVKDEARLRIIERPGLWMSRHALDTIVGQLRQVVKTLIPAGLDYGILSGEKRRLDQAIISILYDQKTRRPIAFNVYSYLEVELHGRSTTILHLGLVMVDPAYQAKGYTWVVVGLPCLLVFLRSGLQPVWFTSVTQVPAIVGKVAEAFANVYPSPFGNAHRSFAHVAIATQVMDKHRDVFGVGPEAEFDEEAFVIHNAYTRGSDNLKKTFAVATKHRDERVNEMCSKALV